MIEALALAAWLQATPPPPLPQRAPYEGDWVVEVVDNVPVMPESQITMQIRGTGVRGLASCNSYQGTITTERDGALRVGQLLKTLKACDPARGDEERDFFAILNDVVTYDVSADTLILRTAQGKTLTARRAPTTP